METSQATLPKNSGASSGPLLAVRNLGKTYRKGMLGRSGFRALDGITIEVGRGSIFGLLGPNGAGKTTLVKILLGLVRGYDGEAELFGRPPADQSARKRVGFLPEAHRLPGYLTGRQMLRLFGLMSGSPLSELDDRIHELLGRVGMESSADRKIGEYSKGMQQRIGLAQALVHDPELVFLDEPTDGVDPVGRAAIRELVLELKHRGVTLFINSHLLLEVELMCDRVVIMTRGKILREGTMDELTPRTGAVRFQLSKMPSDLAGLMSGIGKNFAPSATGFELSIDEPEIDRAVDRLRAAGVGIRGIEVRRLNLEESFIDLVQKEQR